MNLNEFLQRKIKTGKESEFSVGNGKTGKVVVITTNDDKKYVIANSLTNFSRFEKWMGKSSLVDILKTGKFYKTTEYGFLPLVNIRTNVMVDADKQDQKPLNNTSKDNDIEKTDDELVF